MLFPKIVPLLVFILLPLCYTTVSSNFSNALALIESQGDMTLIAQLIRRDPDLVELYSSVKNVTVVAAVDSSFSTINTSSPLFANTTFVRDNLQNIVIEGQYPTNTITTNPIYANTKMSDPFYANTSRGRAVAKLNEVDGKNRVELGTGTFANITQGVCQNSHSSTLKSFSKLTDAFY